MQALFLQRLLRKAATDAADADTGRRRHRDVEAQVSQTSKDTTHHELLHFSFLPLITADRLPINSRPVSHSVPIRCGQLKGPSQKVVLALLVGKPTTSTSHRAHIFEARTPRINLRTPPTGPFLSLASLCSMLPPGPFNRFTPCTRLPSPSHASSPSLFLFSALTFGPICNPSHPPILHSPFSSFLPLLESPTRNISSLCLIFQTKSFLSSSQPSFSSSRDPSVIRLLFCFSSTAANPTLLHRQPLRESIFSVDPPTLSWPPESCLNSHQTQWLRPPRYASARRPLPDRSDASTPRRLRLSFLIVVWPFLCFPRGSFIV